MLFIITDKGRVDNLKVLTFPGFGTVFIITDKAKTSRGGGKRCRCYERRTGKT